MNEYIYVEFAADENNPNDIIILDKKLNKLIEDNFIIIFEVQNIGPMSNGSGYIQSAVCRMTSEQATLIKLSDSFLAERMHVSYIDDALKDQYRK